MATFNAHIGNDMYSQSNVLGSYVDGVAMNSVRFALTDSAVNSEIYTGNFKYKDGYITSGTVTSYDDYEWAEETQDLVHQFTVTGLKLNAKTVEKLVLSDWSKLLPLALKGNDTMYGNNGDDIITGGLGNDKIYGNAGIDYIIGGLGKDILTGGSGADEFMFDTKLGSSNVDTITDFVSGEDGDWLDLDLSIFTKLPESIKILF